MAVPWSVWDRIVGEHLRWSHLRVGPFLPVLAQGAQGFEGDGDEGGEQSPKKPLGLEDRK